MTTTKRANTNGEDVAAQQNPLLTNEPPPEAPTDWRAEAQRLEAQVRFWKMRYFEQMQHSQSQSQVIAELARPQMEQDARAQAQLMSKLANNFQGNRE